jgi:hypothetical protein
VVAEPLTPAIGPVWATLLSHAKKSLRSAENLIPSATDRRGDEAGGASFEVLEIEPRRVVLGSGTNAMS